MHGLPQKALDELDTLYREYQATWWKSLLPEALTSALDRYKIARDRSNHIQIFSESLKICEAYSSLIVSHHSIPSFAGSNLYKTWETLQKYKLLEGGIWNATFYSILDNPSFEKNSLFLEAFLKADVFKEGGAKSSILRYLSCSTDLAHTLFANLQHAGLLEGGKAKDNILKALTYASIENNNSYGVEHLNFIIEILLKNNLFSSENAQNNFEAITRIQTYEYLFKLSDVILNLALKEHLSKDIGELCFRKIVSAEIPNANIYQIFALLQGINLYNKENCEAVLNHPLTDLVLLVLKPLVANNIMNSEQKQVYFSLLLTHKNLMSLNRVIKGLEANQILDEAHFKFFLFKSHVLFEFEGANKFWSTIPKTALTQEHFENLQKICSDNGHDVAMRQSNFINYAKEKMQSREPSVSVEPVIRVKESKLHSAQEPEIIKQSSKAARNAQAGMYLPYVAPKVNFTPPQKLSPN